MNRLIYHSSFFWIMTLAAVAPAVASPGSSSDNSHRDQVKVEGAIESIDAASIVVRGAPFVLTAETKFEDRNSRPADPALFVVGALVEVSGTISGATLTATEIELHSNGTSGGGSTPPTGAVPVKTRLAARLAGLDATVTASADSKYRFESKRGKSEETFTINLKLKVPSVLPAVATLSEALPLPMEAVLTRNGTAYATCSLQTSRVRAHHNKAAVEYRVDLREKNSPAASSFDEKKGQCDIDLTVDGVQSGIPAVVQGDTISIQAQTASADVPFLIGIFAQGR